MKLASDNETLAENKVLVLYILNKVGKEITNDSLLNLIMATTDINYFYFEQFLLDLKSHGYILDFEKDNQLFYEITPIGKTTLKLTEDLIPGITKLRVDTNFKEELSSFEDKHSIIAEYTPQSENNFTVTCKIIDSNDIIFEAKTFAGSRNQAKEIVDNWNNNAEKIYPEILKLLTETKK